MRFCSLVASSANTGKDVRQSPQHGIVILLEEQHIEHQKRLYNSINFELMILRNVSSKSHVNILPWSLRLSVSLLSWTDGDDDEGFDADFDKLVNSAVRLLSTPHQTLLRVITLFVCPYGCVMSPSQVMKAI